MTDLMKFGLLFFLCVIFFQTFADEIKLADASASASVARSLSPTGFVISVVFRPVTTLDEVTNGEMTEVLAQFYAEEALSLFLKESKAIVPIRAKFSFERVNEGKEKWSFVVPEVAVIDAPVLTVETRAEIVGKKSSSKPSTKTRILDFRSSCFRDLRVAETLFAEKVDAVNGQEAKVALRKKIQEAFSALRLKIKADDDLFRSEKEELVNKVEKVEGFLVARIDGDDSEFNRKEQVRNLPIIDAVFTKPYGDLLCADPILLTRGGARIVEWKEGAIAILAVGFASADNDEREDIAELKASAELGKLLAGEETLFANKLERCYSSTTNGDEVRENLEKKRVSTISVHSMDFHKVGETVGTWFSKDGKRFFLAKGRIVVNGSKRSGP